MQGSLRNAGFIGTARLSTAQTVASCANATLSRIVSIIDEAIVEVELQG